MTVLRHIVHNWTCSKCGASNSDKFLNCLNCAWGFIVE